MCIIINYEKSMSFYFEIRYGIDDENRKISIKRKSVKKGTIYNNIYINKFKASHPLIIDEIPKRIRIGPGYISVQGWL